MMVMTSVVVVAVCRTILVTACRRNAFDFANSAEVVDPLVEVAAIALLHYHLESLDEKDGDDHVNQVRAVVVVCLPLGDVSFDGPPPRRIRPAYSTLAWPQSQTDR